MTSLRAGILGATGTVGQRFVTLLAKHPHFVVHALGASTRSAGKPYGEVVRWKMSTPVPSTVAGMVVLECRSENFKDCHVVFSGLDSDVAGEIEMEFLKADLAVFSNAKNYRRDPTVPLVVPTVNPDHLDMILHQQRLHSLKRGFLVTNANCSTTGLVVALKPLQDTFGPLESVTVHTMQAISGAGYPGIASLDVLDNVVPFIDGEEGKMEWETLKILGDLNKDGVITHTTTNVSATCNRVPVLDGHLECVSVRFQHRPPPSPEDVIRALEAYVPGTRTLSSPERAIIVTRDRDRPQPRLDRENGNGYSVTVGRIRECNVFDIKFTLLVHNTLLGAAGSGILNAEIAVARGYIVP